MEAEFWKQRWEKGEVGFHCDQANPLLVKNFEKLELMPGSRVFVPLCGKTLDIDFFLSKNCRVVGVELSSIAVKQLFAQLNLKPQIENLDQFKIYSAKNIQVYVGDIFNLTKGLLGEIDAIYDRAALVALPELMRKNYADHLMKISDHAKQLVICFEYDQSVMPGPPFSISRKILAQYYQTHYQIELLEKIDVAGGLKGKCSAFENIYLLKSST